MALNLNAYGLALFFHAARPLERKLLLETCGNEFQKKSKTFVILCLSGEIRRRLSIAEDMYTKWINWTGGL